MNPEPPVHAPAASALASAASAPPLRWYNLNRREALVLMFAVAALSVSILLQLARGGQPSHAIRHEHASVTGVLDVNHASASELSVIPGVGATTAATIVAERDRDGPFQSLEDFLQRVSRLNDRKIGDFRSYLVFRSEVEPDRLMPQK